MHRLKASAIVTLLWVQLRLVEAKKNMLDAGVSHKKLRCYASITENMLEFLSNWSDSKPKMEIMEVLARQNTTVNTEVLQLIATGDVSYASARTMFADHLQNIPPSTSVPFFLPFYEQPFPPRVSSNSRNAVGFDDDCDVIHCGVPPAAAKGISAATPLADASLDSDDSDREPPKLLDGTDDSESDDGIPPGLRFIDKTYRETWTVPGKRNTLDASDDHCTMRIRRSFTGIGPSQCSKFAGTSNHVS